MGDSDIYTIQVTWGQWVGWRRNELDLTKQGLAQVLEHLGFDTTRQTIWRIETGKVKTTEETRRAIEAALDACEVAQTRKVGAVA